MTLRVHSSVCYFALAIVAPAFSQTVPAPSSSASPTDSDALAAIVVTGSRVITNGNDSPTPLTVVSSEQLLKTTPTNIADALNKLPVFANSNTVQILNGASANSTGNFLNLRSFGANRTLILLDGKRVPSSNAAGEVDTNIIPEMLLERVDVVTGGASAVYGSDAVTGVVNYILDKKYDGLKAEAQAGVSEHGDAKTWRAGIAGGTGFIENRGHAEVSFEHFQQDGIDSKLARANGRNVYSETGAGTAANPFVLVENSRNNFMSPSGLILSGPLAGQQLSADGTTIAAFNPGTPTGTGGVATGGDGTFYDKSGLTAGLKADRSFGRLSYDFLDNVTAYVQSIWARSENENSIFNFTLFPGFVTVAPNNPFVSSSLRAQMGGVPFSLARVYSDVPGVGVNSVTSNLDVTVGLTGKIAGNFDWDIYYTRGTTKARITDVRNINIGRLFAALDAVNVGGSIQCANSSGANAGCVPLDPLVSGAEAAKAINWTRGNTDFVLTNKMDDVGASINGSPFSTWAAPVRMALSAEYRKASLSALTSVLPGDSWLSNTVGNSSGSENVKEEAFEVNMPLLVDRPLAKSVSVNGAIRNTNYSTSGNALTWKLGGDWRLNNVMAFRVTRSRDIRAPNLTDLFAPSNTSLTGFLDTHTNTSGIVSIVTQGNPNLKPEVAQTWTAGVIISPIRELSLSVDYYRINIKNAITQVGGNDATSLRICEDSGGTSPVCSLYVRPHPFSDTSPDNYPTKILSQGLNIASAETNGVDSEINYTVRVLETGRLNLRAFVDFQPSLKNELFGNTINSAGAAGAAGINSGVAKWRASMFASFDSAYWGVAVQERWRDSLKQSGNPNLVFLTPKVPAVAFTDLTFTAHPDGRTNRTVFLSVQNLFNKIAPVYTSPATASNPGFAYPAVDGDDVIGRQFMVGVRFQL